MIFRPLCIDYRSRAQEVLAIERDVQARRAASCFLPHRVPMREVVGDADALLLPATDNRYGSKDDGTNVESSRDDDATKESRDNPPKSKSFQRTLQKLPPAVHPSEVALRTIPPVTTGPIRNKPLEIQTRPILSDMVEMHHKIMKGKMEGAIMSLESGRSRFREEPLLLDEDLEHPFFDVSMREDDSFIQTMMLLYSQNGHLCSPIEADTLKDSLNSIEVNPKPLFIRHEPPDLTKIHQLKSLRAEDATSYADSLGVMFRPELSSLSGDTRSVIGREKSDTCSFSARPKFNMSSLCDAQSNTIDFSSREVLVPFTNFFQDICQQDNESPSKEQRLTICNALSAMDEIGSFIRIDPDIPTVEQESEQANAESSYEAMNKSLDDLCSASSVAARLNLPTRFEVGHDFGADNSRLLVTIDIPRFKFLNDVMEQYKATIAGCPSSFESCLRFIESRDVAGSRNVIPRKICLESSIRLFDESTKDEPSGGPIASTTDLVARLPNFSSLLTFSPAFREWGAADQQRHVASSARISDARALNNVIDSGRAPCLFLPQVSVKSRAESASSCCKRDRLEEDAITNVLRSIVPSENHRRDAKILKEQNSNYPIKNWFSANGTGGLPECHAVTDSKKWTDLEIEEMKKRRKAFCNTAQEISQKENYRTVLNTGCSARRNVLSAFSYRGLLTNQLVDPKVYELRYLSMLGMQKACRLNSQTTFAAMSHDILIEALLRSGKAEDDTRAAPLLRRLKTKRHDSLELDQEQNRKSNPFETQSAALSKIPCIDNLAQTRKNSDALPGNIMEGLGETLKRERGELLHLVSKADELQKVERGYLEELRVLNRHAKSAKHDLFDDLDMTLDVDVCRNATNELPEQSDLPNCIEKKQEVQLPVKRKDPPDECIEEKRREKKKRKKEKRKNETAEERAKRKALKKNETPEERSARKAAKKETKDRKRKSKPDSSFDELVAGNADEKKPKFAADLADGNSQDSSPLATVLRNVKVVPSVELGITPIMPPEAKKSKQPATKSIKTVQKPVVDSKRGIGSVAVSHKIKDSTLLSISKSTSPDSVASWNEGRKLLFTSVKKSCVDRLRTPREFDDDNLSLEKDLNDVDLFGSDKTDAAFDDESRTSSCKLDDANPSPYNQERNRDILEHPNDSNMPDPVETELASRYNEDSSLRNGCRADNLTLLSSEVFLENFTETIAELASGRWRKTLSPADKNQIDALSDRNITICDCPLVDLCGVDIELNGQGVIVFRLSSYLENDQGIQKASREFIRRLVLLAASGRYSSLHVLLCVDIDITSTVSNEIATLQNALVQQSGCYCQVTFEFVAPRILSASLGLRLLSSPSHGSNICDVVSDENTLERARFLIMLVPSMTIHMALKCLDYSEGHQSGESLYNLFRLARSMGREEFVKGSTMLSDTAAHQLWMALHVDISHAH